MTPLNTDLAQLRRDYAQARLSEADSHVNPIAQFAQWFEQALSASLTDANAMTLATVDADGKPSARIVLLKGLEGGFTFFTNYESRKGQALLANPNAALLFYWAELERQVRIEGRVTPLSAEESDDYFAQRPLFSRLGAWASPQSAVIPDRAWLEQREHEFSTRFGDNPPRPPHWGGYRLTPSYLEFWQGRPSRLHDRLTYVLQANGTWLRQRLAP